MSRSLHAPLLATWLLASLAACLPLAAQAQSLIHLTATGNTIADGDKACPTQPYYLYSGGKADSYQLPVDYAYPSTNLVSFIPPGGPTVGYDAVMHDGRFGDSFNLQNTRSVCYAIIQFRAKVSQGGSTNDGLTFGHVQFGGSPFDIVGQVINPAGTTTPQSYALDATGLSLLSAQTGVQLGKTPLDSIFDVYLQDDTKLDYFRMYVWYGPNCSQTTPTSC
jgi:hypothetical protein